MSSKNQSNNFPVIKLFTLFTVITGFFGYCTNVSLAAEADKIALSEPAHSMGYEPNSESKSRINYQPDLLDDFLLVEDIIKQRISVPYLDPEDDTSFDLSPYARSQIILAKQALGAKHVIDNRLLKPVTQDQADSLSFSLQFKSNLAWQYLKDGCYARSHVIAKYLQDRLISNDKIWIFGRLSPKGNSQIQWKYHVASVIYIVDRHGVIKLRVLDPSISSSAISLKQWILRMNWRPTTLSEYLTPIAANNGIDLTINNDVLDAFNNTSLLFSSKVSYLPSCLVSEFMGQPLFPPFDHLSHAIDENHQMAKNFISELMNEFGL